MRFTFSLAIVVAWTSFAGAQTPPAPPRIALVQPAGGRVGSEVTLTVTGQELNDVEGLHFSFPGAKVEVLQAEKVMDEPTKRPAQKMMATGPRTAQKFKVTLPAGVTVGIHDVRIVSKGGISNPRAFVVGDLPEENEKEPNDDVPQAQKVPLNVTINGVIGTATDVDYFQFAGKKGQRIVVSCLSSSIDSKLPAALQLYSLTGKYLGFNRNYQNNDAVLDATLPEDGEYLVRLFGFTHTQGGPDNFYRLTISTGPWIDAVMPVAVEPGKETKVTVWGRNLPGGVLDPQAKIDGRPLEKVTLTVKAPGDAKAQQRLAFTGVVLPLSSSLDGFELRIPSPTGASNPHLLTFAKSPVVLEAEPNDKADLANAVTVPCEITGRIDQRGDHDWYRFTAKKGDVLALELFGDRLGPVIDLKYTLQNAKGTTLLSQDDNPEIMANTFYARSDDPVRTRFVVPADGDYRVGVSSSDSTFGPRHVYSLRIAPEDGDFRVVAMPLSQLTPESAITGPGGNYAFHLLAWRLGNFVGDITIQGGKLPPGISVKPQVISATQKQAAIVLSVAPGTPAYTGPIELEAKAMIDGKPVVREVRAATISHPIAQAGPTITRMDREIALAVRQPAQYELVPSTDKITVALGDKIVLSLKVNALDPNFKAPAIQVIGVGLPIGMVLQPTSITPGKDAVALQFDGKGTVLPGNFTLVLRGQTQPVMAKPPTKPVAGNLVEHAPPISLTIVPKQLLKITPPANSTKVPLGKSAEVSIPIAKLFAFDGTPQVEVTPGTGNKSVTGVLEKITGDEVKLRITAAPDATLGSAVLNVRVTARFNDLAIVHEAKVPVTVTK